MITFFLSKKPFKKKKEEEEEKNSKYKMIFFFAFEFVCNLQVLVVYVKFYLYLHKSIPLFCDSKNFCMISARNRGLHEFSCWLQSLLSGLESPETMGIRLRAMWNMLGALQNSSKGSAETAKGCTEYFAPARNIRHPHGISRTRTEYSAPARNIPFACEYSVRL